MKNTLIWIILVVPIFMINSCSPLEVEGDAVPPGPVEITSVVPVPGGFDVSYKLPADKDLLYVVANYEVRDGKSSEVKASAYQNNLLITGFGDVSEKTVSLTVK